MKNSALVVALALIGMTACQLDSDILNQIDLGGFIGPQPAPSDCFDPDGDGHGTGCALGPDCADYNAAIFLGAPERCNGIDDDCDESIDESFQVGALCNIVLDDCIVPGAISCVSEQESACASSPLTPVDLCNNQDDDCDGQIDESDPSAGTPCDADMQPGTCAQGTVICSSGALVCAPGDSTPETCDAQDNDCDGIIDEAEGGVELQVACRPDVPNEGQCNPGTFFCTGNEAALWGACIGYTGPQAEICDTLDNDCDGEIDELAGGCQCFSEDTEDDCYTGPPGTLGVGTCTAGPTRACEYDMTNNAWDWAECQDTPPTIESCDGLDNDCDGTIDEDLALGDACTVGQGACAAEGQIACDDGVATCNAMPNASQDETCNEIDDDCDGRVDETDGAACSTGTGACERNGVNVCDAASGQIVCSVQPGDPSPEICDGIDNDCDGNTDEGLNLGEACTAGEGACAQEGIIECNEANEAVCSATPTDPIDELCDGLDNDCDGTTDEDLGIGSACNGEGECGMGVFECGPDNNVRCSTDAGASADESINETCDGLDNDCDNEIDEVWQIGTECSGACGMGAFECNAGGFAQCSTDAGGTAHNPVAETCDGVDNDCNYAVDEGFDVGLPCGDGQCAGGSNECDDVGGVRCSTGPGGSNDLSAAETCNGTDEDCDGSTDETWNIGDACDGIGECGAGAFECADAANARCSTDPGGSADGSIIEVCTNGLDDDCDGTADEGCPPPPP